MKIEYYISVVEFLMGRDKDFPPTPEMVTNYGELIPKVNQILELFFIDNPDAPRRNVNSGYRTPQTNANTPGAAKKSNHLICAAIDLSDSDGLLDNWCLKNIDKLNELGLYLEDPSRTPTWTHLQCKPPRSGSNPFLP